MFSPRTVSNFVLDSVSQGVEIDFRGKTRRDASCTDWMKLSKQSLETRFYCVMQQDMGAA